jgi:glycosyltransferase
MKREDTAKKELLVRIASHLILNASFITDLGLYHGKMGIVLFFYELGRYTGKNIYAKFAGELLDEIYNGLNNETLLNFQDGLCGIGWGIAYLIKAQFVKADPDEVLEELDKRIVEWDVGRITDGSLRTGLMGVACYVINRKTACSNAIKEKGQKGKSANVITDDYCRDLMEALKKNDEKSSKKLTGNLEKILKGESLESMYNPVLQLIDKIRVTVKKEALFEKPRAKGLDNNGLAGTGLKLIREKKTVLTPLQGEKTQRFFQTVQKPEDSPSSGKVSGNKKLFIFTKTSRAANYGIGTYIDNLIKILHSSSVEFGLVHLHSETSEVKITEKEGYMKIEIPYSAAPVNNARKYYYRNVAYLLKEFMAEDKGIEYLFHLNFMGEEDFVRHLKKMFHCKIIQAVHYTDWSFLLSGNRSQFRRIISTATRTGTEKELHHTVKELYRSEKKLFERVDRIVCLSENTRRIIEEDYRIDPQKLSVIYNGLSDEKSKEEKGVLRSKYGLTDVPVVLFTGRLDEIKGLKYAIQSFKIVLKTIPYCRMIIIGNGNFDLYTKECEDIWINVTFTGLIDRQHLYEFYTVADLGVMPSLHEQCSYVAIEMMMHGVPLVASTSTGLCEMVEDGVTGLHVPVEEFSDRVEIRPETLAEKMLYLLQHPEERERLGRNARRRYEAVYSLKVMSENMIELYSDLRKEESSRNGLNL